MANEAVKLEPCPFCGGTNLSEAAVSNTGGNVRYVWCRTCNAEGPWSSSREGISAAAAWNRRATRPSREDVLADLVKGEQRQTEVWPGAPSVSASPVAPETVKEAGSAAITDDQIKHMAERFLGWRLPDPWYPDGGITFESRYNVNNQYGWPEGKREPTGTNLFDYTQAVAMVRHMIEGLPASPASPSRPVEAAPEHFSAYTRDQLAKLAFAVFYSANLCAPQNIAAVVKEIDCCPGCDHVSTSGSTCYKFEKGEFCPNLLAEDLRQISAALYGPRDPSHYVESVFGPDKIPALAAPPPREPEGMDAATVEVKPLEWIEPYANKLDASSACGVYGMALVAGKWFIRLNGSAIEPGHPYHSFSAAKAAAQADYEARIRSALTMPVTGEAEPVANPFDLTMTQFLDKMAARGVSFTTPGQAAVVLDWAYATFRAYASPVLPTTAEAEGMVQRLRGALAALVDDILISVERWGDSITGPATVSTEPGDLPVSQEAFDEAVAALAAAASPAKSPPSQGARRMTTLDERARAAVE